MVLAPFARLALIEKNHSSIGLYLELVPTEAVYFFEA